MKCWGWVVLSNPAVELGALSKPCQRTIFTLLGQWRQIGAKAELCATVTFIFLLIYLTEQAGCVVLPWRCPCPRG